MCKLEKMVGISGRICGACEEAAVSFCFQLLARLVLGCETEGVWRSFALFFSFLVLAALWAG